MIICVICLSIESNNKKNEENIMSAESEQDDEELDGNQKALYCFFGILLVTLAAAMMSTKHLVIKFVNIGGYTAFD